MTTCYYYFFSVCTLRNCVKLHSLAKCQRYPHCSYGTQCIFVHIREELFEELSTCASFRPYREEIAQELGRLCRVFLTKIREQDRPKFCFRQVLGNFCHEDELRSGAQCDECSRNKNENFFKTRVSHICGNVDCMALLHDGNIDLLPCYHLYCRSCVFLLPEKYHQVSSGLRNENKLCLRCDAETIRLLSQAPTV